MNIYKAEDVRRIVSCETYLTNHGVEVKAHRCAATWRGGDGQNVSIDTEKNAWFDHVEKRGGSVIDLCMEIEGLPFLAAVRTLGDRYNVEPFKQSRKSSQQAKSKMNIVKEYDYTDENGSFLFQAVRLDPKDFRQRRKGADGKWIWNLQGVRLVPYNLPKVKEAASRGGLIIIAEGEKDVETLGRLGFTATCNPMGAGKWEDEYNRYLSGAQVLIFADKDAAPKYTGQHHAAEVRDSLGKSGVTASVAYAPDGFKDVTDWIDSLGGDVNAIENARIKIQLLADNPPPWEVPAAISSEGNADFTAMLIRGNDLHAMPEPKHRWILDQLIERGDKGQIVAPPKTRKTYTGMNLAIDIRTGRPFMGFEVCERVPVLYVDLELKKDNLIRREHKITADLGITEMDGVDWLSMRGRGRQVRENEEAFISLIRANGYGIVFLDCTYKLYLDGENENDAVAMNQYLDWKSRICEASGAAVVDVLHDAKGYSGDRQGNDRGSGSNVHARDYDFRMVLTPDAMTKNGIVFDFLGREIENSTDRLGVFEGPNCSALIYHPEIKAVKLTSATAKALTEGDSGEARRLSVIKRDAERMLNEIIQKGVGKKSEVHGRMHLKGVSRERVSDALLYLIQQGKLDCRKFKGFGRVTYDMVGTPSQLDSLQCEVEAGRCHLDYLAGYSQGEIEVG